MGTADMRVTTDDAIESTLWIVMGQTEERVFEKSIPLTGDTAMLYCYKLNHAYIKARVAIRYYITPVLDV